MNDYPVQKVRDLRVYKSSFESAMQIHQVSKSFPKEETYSLTDQIRRSSRSICANLAESWAKRRYKAAFISKLTDVHQEASETQTWLEFAVALEYISKEKYEYLFNRYEHIIAQIITMQNKADSFTKSK
jgi:four helix bundle protein